MTDTTEGRSARWPDDDAPTRTLPTASPLSAPELTGVGAGIVGAALTALGVWGLHVLTRGDGVAGAVGWVILLCLAFSALGKGITLLRRALAPLSAVLSASVAGVPPLQRAAMGIVIGAAGIWWVMRGHAAMWWAQLTGNTPAWTLPSQLVLVAIIVIAGALLFGGAKTLGQLIFANSGTRQHPSPNHADADRWRRWWSSHPGLGLTLLAGGAALVFLSGYVVPRVSGWLTGRDPMAALAAITAILTLALLANTWWWRALTGWWTWAHTPNGPGGPTPMGQIYAGAGVLALIAFSATAFGMATFASYLPQTAAVASADPCGDRCGGGGNGQGSYGPDTGNFQPPQMPGQQPDYQGGINQPPLDQNSGISIYNESPGQGGMQQSQNLGPQMPGQRAAHGEPLPNYGPWQPDAQPPAQAPQPVQQAPQAPQQPVQQAPQAPQNPAGQQPAQQAPQQPAQQVPQQPGAQQPQGQPGQQPAQQGQPGQQQPQNPANQQSPQQQTPQQQPQKEPETPKKNPIDPTDLATAATRRGSRQAGQQAAQQGTQQATQQATQATQQTQQATQQATQQGTQKAVESGDQFPADFHMGQVGDGLSKTGKYANTGTHWSPDAKVSTMPKSTAQNLLRAGEKFTWLGRGMEVAKAGVDLANGAPVPETIGGTVGSLAGAWAGAEGGAIVGATIGSFFPGPGTVIGGAVGGVVGGFVGSGLGSEVGKAVGGAARAAGSALSTAGGAVASFFGSL